MLTLWDMGEREPSAAKGRAARRPAKDAAVDPAPVRTAFDVIVERMLARHDVKVRRWRRSTSGLASVILRRNGTIERWVESPRPTTALSLAVFLHEIGHHALGIGAIRPRCLEEYHAWQFAFAAMREFGVPVTDRVRERYERSMRYAVQKAARRKLRVLPSELLEFAR